MTLQGIGVFSTVKRDEGGGASTGAERWATRGLGRRMELVAAVMTLEADEVSSEAPRDLEDLRCRERLEVGDLGRSRAAAAATAAAAAPVIDFARFTSGSTRGEVAGLLRFWLVVKAGNRGGFEV